MKWDLPKDPADLAARFDAEMKKVVGVGWDDWDNALAVTGPLPMAMYNAVVDLIDRSGVVPELEAWALETRRSKAGRKALISFRAVLVVELLCALWTKGAQYQEICNTLAYRMSPEQFQVLGINWEKVEKTRWYHRHWRAKQRLLKAIDPYHATSKKQKITLAAAMDALNAKDDERERRLLWVMQSLVSASVSLLPQRYRDAYNGDVALDSTRIRIQGPVHSAAFTEARKGTPLDHPKVIAASRTLRRGGKLTNVDFTAGTYDRGHHERPGKGAPEPAHELDFISMMDTRGYDDYPAFARIITGISIHRPSEITKGPLRAMRQHSALFTQRGIACGDRAFNNSESQNFQQPLRIDYWEMCFDYKENQFGRQGVVAGKDIVVIDGVPYVDRLPRLLVNATSQYKNGELNPDSGRLWTWPEIEKVLEDRKVYQMKRHGSLFAEQKNGHQRFVYPDPKTYRAFDPATNKPIDSPREKNKLRGSVLIAPDAEVVKHLQRYPWGTPEWEKAYGQRNQVESSNSGIKRSRFTDLEDPQKRPGRGVAYQGMASALMVVAHNLRMLVNALISEHKPKAKTPRAPRRKYSEPVWRVGADKPAKPKAPPKKRAA